MSKLLNLVARACLVVSSTTLAAPAFAQPIAAPDAPLSVVSVAQRLTALGVFTNAKPIVQVVVAGLIVATLYAAFVYGRGLVTRRAQTGSVFLSALSAGGPLVGLFGASYGLLDCFIGVSNVRPTPSLSILAPGFAEAALSLTLGLLAGAIAVIGHRHLTGRAQALTLTAPAIPESPATHLARAMA